MEINLMQEKIKFFKDGIFRINLAFDEIENQILIPGHRFLPFLNPEINPNKITIYDRKGEKLPPKVFSVNPERIKQYYSLFGLDNFLFILIADIKKNSDIIMKEEDSRKRFLITAYSLKSLFQNKKENTENFKPVLELKIEDWEKGIYTAVLREKPEDKDNVSVWVENLEKGLLKAEGYKNTSNSIEEYMSTAFFLGGEYLIKNPAVTLDEFQGMSDRDFISSFHSKSVTSRILEKSKQDLNSKISGIITSLGRIEKDIINGKIKEVPEKRITLDKISNTISTLRSFSSELDSPDINEEKLNIIIKIIEDSEKLTKL